MEIILSLQLQMEKLPSRNAISEMIGWMNAVEPQAAGEDTELSHRSASQVKSLLQKLKVITQQRRKSSHWMQKPITKRGKVEPRGV